LPDLPLEETWPRKRRPIQSLNHRLPLGFPALPPADPGSPSNVGPNCWEPTIIGKAATLNARIGDVLIPNVVYDEHSRNTYLFGNVFTAAHVRPHLVYGDVLDNQRALTVPAPSSRMTSTCRLPRTRLHRRGRWKPGRTLRRFTKSIRPRRYPDQ